MRGLKQPALGIAATILAVTLSLAFVSLFEFPMFGSWIAYLMNCIIPMQICIGITWRTNQPAFAAKQKQPLKGILLAVLTLVSGAIVAPVYLLLIDGNLTTPGPVPSHLIIASVIVTFWAAIVFGGWPFKALIKNEVAAGLAMLVSVYAINFLLFRLLFDYSFMQSAPHGLFNAVQILVFYVTFVAAMFFVVAFDLWPM